MFLNRGMIEAAKTEGEVAGVMAHEICARGVCATARPQATKGAEIPDRQPSPARCLAPLSAAPPGAIIAQGSQLGLGTYFLKYSREYESAGRPARERRFWRVLVTTRARWPTCSRRIEAAGRRQAARSA